MSITIREIKEIALEACRQQQIPVPNTFKKDWNQLFPDENLTLTSFHGVRMEVCQKIKEALQEKKKKERYEPLFKTILTDVRVKIAKALNFEEKVATKGKGETQSKREVLQEFLHSLQSGKTWSPEDLRSWGAEGYTLYLRVYNTNSY